MHVKKRARVTAMRYTEIVFDGAYLATLAVIVGYLLATSIEPMGQRWAVLCMVLLVGDAFHLVPRIGFSITQNRQLQAAMALGKQVTSVTMTLFYVLLWYIGSLFAGQLASGWTVVVCGLAAVRIVLCLLPQNQWYSTVPNVRFAIWRNVPFVLLGGVVTLFFAVYRTALPATLGLMAPAIVLSFAFYIPVVLFVHKYPTLGMLMLPKTCVYVWMACMGLGLA